MNWKQPSETSPNALYYSPLPPGMTRFVTFSFGGYKVAGRQVLMSPHCSGVALTAGIPSLCTMAALKWNHMEMFPSIHRRSNSAARAPSGDSEWNSCRLTSAAVELHCLSIALPIKLFLTTLTLLVRRIRSSPHQCRQHGLFWYYISFISKSETHRFLTWNGWYGTNVATMNTVSISTTIALPTSLLHPCSQLRDPPFLLGTFGPPS